MKRNFVQVARFLEQKFPGQVEVEGDFYPAPPAVELLSNLTNIIQLIAILWMVLGGENLLRMVGYKNGMPRWFSTVQENAFQIGVAIFLILPQVVAKWTLSGAFEVFLDGEQVWSKLEAGGFPTQDQLVSPLLEAGLTQQS